MKTGQAGIGLIKEFEGCHLEAYKCPAGVWTIGYGHTKGVKPGDRITQKEAEELLAADLVRFEKMVGFYDDKYGWKQNEFDALVSFAFNIGSIKQLTADGTRGRDVIAEKILLYNKAGGKELPGLTKRRQKERELFLSASICEANDIKEYSLQADGDKQISKNFKVKEFRCKDGSDKILVDENFIKNKLQAIRDYFAVPITVNSAYRTESHNRKEGGAKASYHLKGQAFDIVVQNHTPTEVAHYAQTLGINGIIQYHGFVHIDSRKARYFAKENNGSLTPVPGF